MENTSNENGLSQRAFIPAEVSLPELTIKAIVISIFLTAILAGANAFLGMKVGMTVSASIPAAVISMGILRFFKTHNVLEINISQTAASAGEALAAGMVFTMPALIIIRYWTHFNYWHTATIAALGGVLGVLFSIPLRKVLLADKTLHFPEGTAIGNVLKASASDDMPLKELVMGGSAGAVISLCESGFKLIASDIQFWIQRGTAIFGFGVGFDAALIGAGYIIGVNVCVAIFLGIVLGWIIGVPLLAVTYGYDASLSYSKIAFSLWADHIRYMGLGVMIVGGFWAVMTMFKPMYDGLKVSIKALGNGGTKNTIILRTDRDMPINVVGWGVLLLLIPFYFLLNHFTDTQILHLSSTLLSGTNVVSLLMILVGGFAIASICAYFAGLVGSSTNPLSSLSLIGLICISLLLAFMFSSHFNLNSRNAQSIAIAAIAIIITAIVAGTAAISNDTIQDLKAGQMVGATPWKQQVMLVLGVVVASFVIPYVLQLLFDAYGIANVFPRPGMDPSQALLAPQAGLMAAAVEAIFTHSMNWLMIGIGGAIAVITLVADRFLMKYNLRLPVLAVGIGIYLPVTTTTSLILGGVMAYLVDRNIKKKKARAKNVANYENMSRQKALLLASGLVAGAALMGVLLAIPFAIEGTTNALRLMSKDAVISKVLGIAVILGLGYLFSNCASVKNKVD